MYFLGVLEPSSYLVLVLGAVEVARLQRGELAALGAGFGARVQLTQLQKVTVFRHIFIGQMGNHHSLLKVATALWDRTADVRFGYSHLGNITKITNLFKLGLSKLTG